MEYQVEFIGGSYDGRIVATDEGSESDRNMAQGYVLMTDDGTIGKQFWAATEYAINALNDGTSSEAESQGAMQAHRYRVVERLAEDNHVLIRCEFVGPESTMR